jgi:hypothetical protein
LANRVSQKIQRFMDELGEWKLELKSIIMHHEAIKRARLQRHRY